MIKTDIVAILDAGSQYGKLIDRRVRELNCFTELLPLNTKASELSKYQAIIISGGPNSFNYPNAPQCDPDLKNLDVPILGICYGMQWLNFAFGGKVKKGLIREDGQLFVELDTSILLFNGLSPREKVLLTHGDSCDYIPEDLEIIGKSEHSVTSIKHKTKPFFGVQFHPEVDLTSNGKMIFSNFLYKIAGLSGTYNMEDRLANALKDLKENIGDKNVVVLVSGGVDSTVCAALLFKVLGADKVHAIHINTGFMRKNEDVLVKEALNEIGFNIKVIDATEEFFNGFTEINGKKTGLLKDSLQPEEKRKIIGDTFINVIMKEIENLNLKEYYLAQGTLRPDLIESASILASSKADVIKTHHNDTALVRKKREEGLIVEPLKDYHKDEVRQLGRMLGLPEKLIERHPFPGPGLAIRIICAEELYVTQDYNDLNKRLKEICGEVQSCILPIKSVGVQGDGRTYSYVAAFHGKPDWNNFIKLTKSITQTLHQINRVVYLFGNFNENEMNLHPTYLREDTINKLREADYIVNKCLNSWDEGRLGKKISQMPVILIPLSFDVNNTCSIVIRPFITNDFMTGVPAIPGEDIPIELLEKIVDEVLTVKGVSRVLIDLTSKPPGTTEWE